MRSRLPLALVAVALAVSGCAPRQATPSADGASATPPAADRDTTIVVDGVSRPVSIVTDVWGIPHVLAATDDDLYFAWGFVTARDRLWQIAHARQGGRGQLWRWFGNRALRGDGGAQLFRLPERAAAIWAREREDSTVRVPLERYAAGINAWLALCRSGARPWPDELAALGVDPDDWRPEDSILIQLGQAFVLDFALPEISEAGEIRRHGADWPDPRRRFAPASEVPTIPDSVSAPWAAATALDANAARAPGTAPAAAVGLDPGTVARALAAAGVPLRSPDERASNVFAVGGARSASGRPLLANDPHLPLTDPNPLHVVHLRGGDVDAAGAAVPGIPILVSGRNRWCAWGLTALSADIMDVYADTLSRDGKRVRTPDGWVDVVEAPFDMRFSVLGLFDIPVPGQKRRYGPHGPIVSVDSKRHVALSVRWAGSDSAFTLRRILGVTASRSADEVAERVRTNVTPTLNFVAADREGGVVYQTVGAVPRRGFEPIRGVLPSDGRHEWSGVIPPDEMPAWHVPADGFVVNANNLPVSEGRPDAWPRFDWAQDRAARMQRLLAGRERMTLEDAAAIQNDVYSRDAARLLPRLLRCADSLAVRLDDEERAALDLLRAWDGTAARGRVAPTIYAAWTGALQRRSKLGGLTGLTVAALDGRAPEALHHPVTGAIERPAEAAVAALRIGLGALRRRFGRDPSKWTWERAHQARFAHDLAWKVPGFQRAPTPIDGDRSTVSVGRSRMPWSTLVTHAPVFRHLVDLAVEDSSLAVIPPGNSGARDHRHATDLLVRWADHAYVPLYLNPERIAAVKESELRLEPGR